MNKFKSKTNISDYVIPMKVKWDQSFLYLKVSTFKWTKSNRKWMFPVDTPLVLRLVKTHMGKCLFSPELKSYLITQWNCTTIGSCSGRKTNQWVGSGAARTYGDDTRRNGRGIWLYKRTFRHRILRLFLLQRRRLRLHWSGSLLAVDTPRSRTQRPRSARLIRLLHAPASQQFRSRSLPLSVDYHVRL